MVWWIAIKIVVVILLNQSNLNASDYLYNLESQNEWRFAMSASCAQRLWPAILGGMELRTEGTKTYSAYDLAVPKLDTTVKWKCETSLREWTGGTQTYMQLNSATVAGTGLRPKENESSSL